MASKFGENEMKLTLGYSPCPNDTFIFGAIALGLIDTFPFRFEILLEDVEALNQKALLGKLDITKVSFNAFSRCTQQYLMLRSGAALGRRCGPLLIAAPGFDHDRLSQATVAIPGMQTTANFLLDFYGPVGAKRALSFDEIESAVLSGKTDAGVIIHENRFTYAEKGLILIADLGDHWEQETGSAIPLGGIAAKRTLGDKLLQKANVLIRESLQFAYEHSSEIMPYVELHAQEMESDVQRKHIELYVNDFTLDLGSEGSRAVDRFIEATGRIVQRPYLLSV